MIYIENKRRKLERIQEQYPNADILDITSASKTKYAQMLSPFYPHGNIPIPLDSNGLKATCVEAVWQGLKVFETEDVNFSTFKNDTMKGLKRTVRTLGTPKGHRSGAYGKDLLGYFDARMKIYLPTYKWVLENVPTVTEIVNKADVKGEKSSVPPSGSTVEATDEITYTITITNEGHLGKNIVEKT